MNAKNVFKVRTNIALIAALAVVLGTSVLWGLWHQREVLRQHRVSTRKRDREDAQSALRWLSNLQENFRIGLQKDRNDNGLGEFGTLQDLFDYLGADSQLTIRLAPADPGGALRIRFAPDASEIRVSTYSIYVWVPNDPADAEKTWIGIAQSDHGFLNRREDPDGREPYVIDQTGILKTTDHYQLMSSPQDIPLKAQEISWRALQDK